MSLLDIDTDILDVLEIVEFNKSPLTDIKNFSKRCHVGLIEGGCANSENVEVLKEARALSANQSFRCTTKRLPS